MLCAKLSSDSGRLPALVRISQVDVAAICRLRVHVESSAAMRARSLLYLFVFLKYGFLVWLVTFIIVSVQHSDGQGYCGHLLV